MDRGAGDVGELDDRAVGARGQDAHLVTRGELRVGADDVLVDEPRRAERAQRELEAVGDVEVEHGRARAPGGVGVAEDIGERLEQRDLRVVGDPRVLVAQLVLAPQAPGL
jgi:hypothetical protein